MLSNKTTTSPINRKQEIQNIVNGICDILDISKVTSFKRCSLSRSGLKSWDFFEGIHSELEEEGEETSIRCYSIESETGNFLIPLSEIPKNFLDFVVDYKIKPMKQLMQIDGVGIFIIRIKKIEKAYRDENGIGYTATDDRVHQVLTLEK